MTLGHEKPEQTEKKLPQTYKIRLILSKSARYDKPQYQTQHSIIIMYVHQKSLLLLTNYPSSLRYFYSAKH